jgi:NADPH-dependent glutamate synthase beta subunit-like oxidoreductase
MVRLICQIYFIVDADYRTHHPKIWAGGGAVKGGKEVVNAVAEAKIAVKSMLYHIRM